MAVLPEGHRLGRRAKVEVAELAEEPLLLLRHDFGSRGWFDAACKVAHIRPRVLLESAAPHTLLALAQARIDSKGGMPIEVVLGTEVRR